MNTKVVVQHETMNNGRLRSSLDRGCLVVCVPVSMEKRFTEGVCAVRVGVRKGTLDHTSRRDAVLGKSIHLTAAMLATHLGNMPSSSIPRLRRLFFETLAVVPQYRTGPATLVSKTQVPSREARDRKNSLRAAGVHRHDGNRQNQSGDRGSG